MDIASVKSPSRSTRESKTQAPIASLKLMVFSVGQLHLALRIEAVAKILNQTTVYSSGLNAIGVAHVGDREITVIDLHRQLFHTSSLDEKMESNYLILLQHPTGECFGLPVQAMPLLIDVPLAKIRTLPESYRQSDTLAIASHIAIVPHANDLLTVFLLHLDQLLRILQA